MDKLHPEEMYGDLTRMELYQAIAKAEKQADEWCDQYKNKRAENIAMHISKDMDIAQLETRETSARAIMQKFVHKVDTGRARSKETYREMKEWLDD